MGTMGSVNGHDYGSDGGGDSDSGDESLDGGDGGVGGDSRDCEMVTQTALQR